MTLAATLLAPWRRRLDAWWQARSPRTDSLLLTQRNVYILPTRGGMLFCFTLGVLLIASINYQLNLGYALTFLLAGSGLVSMHMTHSTLRGLTLHLRPLAPAHAGDTALIEVVLSSPQGRRHGVGMGLRSVEHGTPPLSYTDVPAGGQAVLHLGFVPPRRGRHRLPTVVAETRFPLGLFRAWAVWHPESLLWVYPAPEHPAQPLPPLRSTAGGPQHTRTHGGTDFDGVRLYRRGDPLQSISWKRSAQTLASSGELVSRDSHTQSQQQLWLQWADSGSSDAETRLSRLTAWVLDAHQRDLAWGLHLPGHDIDCGQGEAHRQRSLQALALWTL